MEELTEILTWSKLSLHTKPVALLNVDGYYDHFLQWVGEIHNVIRHPVCMLWSQHNLHICNCRKITFYHRGIYMTAVILL